MKKLILFIFACVLCFFIIGCKNTYGAVMYSQSTEWIKESFLKDNRVYGAFYKNENYDPNSENSEPKYVRDTISPKNRTFIIDNLDEFNNIFKPDTLELDFDKESIYLYIFSDVYGSRIYSIDNISLNDEKVCISYKLEDKNIGDATMPYQRCLIVVMQKNSAKEAEFIEKR